MPEKRSLAPSLSFSGSSSPSTIPRPLKRRLTSTSDLTFFTPAATSFKPRPYNPNVAGVPPSKPLPPRNNHTRSVESLALPSPVMDPSPMDPNCVFIHPPFTSFPGSENYPDGLYYPLMAANPEWFLDPTDFTSTSSTNPNAIPYPPHLEPPRGWCPAKKRDLKERGTDGWPEGEEPRLRCTFCRRTYAGVNAKSMWRRHVFEKHKIAMSNRRDSNERPRGRGSNKENRQLVSGRHNDECHDSILSMDVAPQTSPVLADTAPHKSKFRSLLPIDDIHTKPSCEMTAVSDDKVAVPSAPRIPQKQLPSILLGPSPSRPHPLSESTLPPISPPLTPLADSSYALISTSSPVQPMTVVPPSPYDPLLTPSFRHSPPRLPSDQPWRFPSPSHPLHSSVQELCLTMLAPSGVSPVSKGHSTGASPGSISEGTTLQSPSIVAFGQHKTYNLDPDTPASMEKLSRPSPPTLFSKGRLPLPAADRMNPNHNRCLTDESPLSRNSRRTARSRRKRPVSKSSDDWLSSGSPSSAGQLAEIDPFAAIYNSWESESENLQKIYSPPISNLGESPILRSNILPFSNEANGSALVGLGIGLMEPFTFPHEHSEDDFDYMLMYPALNEEEGDEAEVADVLAVSDEECGDRDDQHAEEPWAPNKRRKTDG